MTTGTKIGIVLQAGTETHEGLARALHALLYTKELVERGREVRLVFDGAGTAWLAAMRKSESDAARGLARIFEGLKQAGVTYEVCDYCSGAFHVREDLQDEPLSGKYMDHPSIADLVDAGFQVWVL